MKTAASAPCTLIITASCTGATLGKVQQIEAAIRQETALSEVSVSVVPEDGEAAVPLRDVLNACADAFGVRREAIQAKGRRQRVVFARHAYCHLARAASGRTLKDVGALINRSHCTVYHSIKASESLLFSKTRAYTAGFKLAQSALSEGKQPA